MVIFPLAPDQTIATLSMYMYSL